MPLQDLTPQLRTRLNRMEKAVGWFVFIAAALLIFGFGYYVYHTAERKGWFVAKAQFKTYLQSSAGLKVGDNVYMMGFPVGTITRVHPLGPREKHNVEVNFEIRDNFFRYIWSEGSYVKVNAGFLGTSQLEITRATNGFALAVTQPVFRKTLEELRTLVAVETNHWQLSQYVYDGQSNVVFIPYQPYEGLTLSNLDLLATLNLESNAVYAYNNRLNRKHVVAVWREELQRYDSYDHRKDPPVELPAAEAVPVAERVDRIVSQVENALPGILALTNKIAAILDNSVKATSNLNTTLVTANTALVAAQPAVTNFAFISDQLRAPGGPLLWALGTNGNDQLQGALTNVNSLLANTDTNLNTLLIHLSEITGELSTQVRANTNLVGGIYQTIVNVDDMVQGLKRHWLLRSAFKTNQPPTKKK